ncbi:MAG: hypothetical protein K6B28_08240 [Lachnospiraceae bacterium]|nr:hypothetical protein [Lachnospiraceae bacterium]
MQNKLKALFDYQRFENNIKLKNITDDVEKRYSLNSTRALSDNDLVMVNAAGAFIASPNEEKPK